MTSARFDWQDGERTIHFGRGRAAEVAALAGDGGRVLLTTERARGQVEVPSAATVLVPAGFVDELAAELATAAGADTLVAVGGGRVIDTAKAIVAARGHGRVVAVPTTLSGAEMTKAHRQARGAPAGTPQVRPAVVVADPALMASQPEPELAASALNAMSHALEGPCTTRSNPLAALAGDEGARLIAGAFAADPPDRDALALGSLLSAYAIDSAGYGLHHVVCQTLVRVGRLPHAGVNAVMLPHTARALAERFPDRLAAAARALGRHPAEAAQRILARTGATRLRDLGADRDVLPRAAEAAAKRGDLALTPPAAGADEIRRLYESAF